MLLVEFSDKDQAAYNNFVTAHKSGSFLQSWDWGNWQNELGNKSYRFGVAENLSGPFLLTAQIIEMDLSRGKKYLYIPYGPLVAMTLSDAKQNEIVEFFLEKLLLRFPKNLFVRIQSKQKLNVHAKATKNIQPANTLLLNLEKTEEQLLKEMHEKTRYNIKVAQRHKVQVVSELVVTPGFGLHLTEVVKLLVATSKRQGYKAHSESYYRNFINYFGLSEKKDSLSLTVYKALLDQKLLACGLMIDFAGTRTYLFGGSGDDQKNVMGPYLLHWQAITDAKKQGLKFYDFWGLETASGTTPGFVRFKLGFGGIKIKYAQTIDLVKNKLWYNIYNVARFLKRKTT